jgi:hypothetical protein
MKNLALAILLVAGCDASPEMAHEACNNDLSGKTIGSVVVRGLYCSADQAEMWKSAQAAFFILAKEGLTTRTNYPLQTDKGACVMTADTCGSVYVECPDRTIAADLDGEYIRGSVSFVSDGCTASFNARVVDLVK